jgi:hypothetical protein
MLPSSPWSLDGTSDSTRDRLINFWLTAPIDQLETLWDTPIGSTTRALVLSLSSSSSFSPEQIALRDSIGDHLNVQGLTSPLSHQIMIANFLLSPPGLLRINNVNEFFPSWLATAYRDLYEVDSSQVNQQQGSDNQITLPTPDLSSASVDPSILDFGPFPTDLSLLISDRVHLNRLLGLSNLYYIDPDDKEVASELLSLRVPLSHAIFNADESSLESLWNTDLGDRYWALVRSGIQSEPLSSEDNTLKSNAVTKLDPAQGGGFGTPGSLNAFLVSMMYFLPGSMKVDDPEIKIPSWLLSSYTEIFANSLSS